MVRLYNHSPARPDCASQRSEDGHVLLVRPISKRGEDVARDIETRLGERRPQIMPQITQPLRRQVPTLVFRQGQQSIRLIDAEHVRAQQSKRTGKPAPTAWRIQEPAPWV